MAEVRLTNVEKRYSEESYAVRGVSLHANDGEFVVLVGPSGCGKSTTLRMIAGLEEITGGEIAIGPTVVNDLEPKDRDVAMVFQNYALYPHMTVYDNMAFPLKMRKVGKVEIKTEVTSAAKVLGIEHLLSRKPKALSGGERQRVAVGRAIVRRPKVFLFDEPLSNLDAALRTQMRAELKRLQRRFGATMVYVTHDQVEAMTMGDKIAVMNKGSLEQFGTPAEIYDRPASLFVARFLGSPPMNIVAGKLVQGKFVAESFSVPAEGADGDAYIGFRPEHVQISSVSDGGNPSSGELRGKLILIEPVGGVTHYHVELPEALGGTFVASQHEDGVKAGAGSSERAATYTLGQTVIMNVSRAPIHLFDRTSEKRL